MAGLGEIANKPLGRLLEGVDPGVFDRPPQLLGLRDLQRDMSSILKKLRVNGEYRVLTNRGAPSFLLIPIDPEAWMSLLVATPIGSDHEREREKAHEQERAGESLPDTDEVLASAKT